MYTASETPITKTKQGIKIETPDLAARAIRESGMVPQHREGFFVLNLDTRHRIIGDPYLVGIGTLNAMLVHPREVFSEAIRLHAHAIIVAHNHPSGESTPSREDIELTTRLEQGGHILGIQVLDHIVLGEDGEFTSMRADLLMGGVAQ